MSEHIKDVYRKWLDAQIRKNQHEKDPYVWKSEPPIFAKSKRDRQKIDNLVSNLPSFYKLDIWDEYVANVTEGRKRLYIHQPPRCGKTLAMDAYKQFCENMEERNMNNITNKNLNDDLNNIHWVVDSMEVEDRPVASVYRPCEFTVTLSGHLKNNTVKEINFYRLTNALADKLNGKTRNTKTPTIKNVIFNDPATIVFWTDNTKTVVKCQEGEKFDPEKGLTMAYFKKMHGNKGHYFEEIKKWTDKYSENSPSKAASEWYSSFIEGFENGISNAFYSLPCQKSNVDYLKKIRDALDEVVKLNEKEPRD